MRINGKWSQYHDANLVRSKNLPKILSRMDKIGMLIKNAYPNPRGAEAIWYRAMINVPMVENGPQNYYCASLYKYWYCNTNRHELEVAGETGIWGEIFVNSLKAFLPRLEIHKLELENNQVILLPKFNGLWKGYPMVIDSIAYQGEKVVVITHNNHFPWKAITQQQYLQVLKKTWVDQKRKTAEGYAMAIADLEKSINEWKANKEIKETDKSEIIKNLENGIREYKLSSGPQKDTIDQYCNRKIAFIDDYIQNNPNDLQRPAIINIQISQLDDFAGHFDDEATGGRQLVVLDPTYFKKNLTDDVPQLMVLRWRWDANAPGVYFKNEFEKNFQFEKLIEMIDK